MINRLSVGLRGDINYFVKSYQYNFLDKHGFHKYQLIRSLEFNNNAYVNYCLYTVDTKCGEMVIPFNGVVTYLGNDLWDISNETQN